MKKTASTVVATSAFRQGRTRRNPAVCSIAPPALASAVSGSMINRRPLHRLSVEDGSMTRVDGLPGPELSCFGRL